MSNIITTNKNRIAIAPTYTIINDKARNSTSKQNKIPAENKNTRTKNITECTGFLELITKKADNKSEILNTIDKRVIFKN